MTNPYPAPPQPAAPKADWYRKRWVQLVGVGLIALVVGSGIGASSAADSDKKADTANERADRAVAAAAAAEAKVVEAEKRAGDAVGVAQAGLAAEKAKQDATLKARADALAKQEATVKAREVAVGTAEKTAAARTLSDGTYVVGEDIKPGTYKSKGGEACYWERQSKSGDIIDNNLGDGAAVMNVRASDYSVEINCPEPFVLQR